MPFVESADPVLYASYNMSLDLCRPMRRELLARWASATDILLARANFHSQANTDFDPRPSTLAQPEEYCEEFLNLKWNSDTDNGDQL